MVDNCETRCLAQTGEALEKSQRSENQDMLFRGAFPEGSDGKGVLVAGVFDGHGTNGRLCASTVRDQFKIHLLENVDESVLNSMCAPGVATNEKERSQDELKEAFKTLFLDVHGELEGLTAEKSSKVNAKFSGTTAVIAIIGTNTVHVLNAGDSDCVLGSLGEEENATVAKLMNPKHLLTIEEEKARIEQAGGRVERQRKKDGTQMTSGPLRVWMKEVQTPGLMVSRSIGDIICHEIGVISDPDYVRHEISPKDTLLVLGSDGLWEFVTPEEAVAFAEDFVSPEEAASGLAHIAVSRQTQQNADNVSVVVMYFESPEARMARLNAKPDFEDRLQTRREEVEDVKEAQKKKIQDQLSQIAKANADAPSTGSILFGAPQPAEEPKPAPAPEPSAEKKSSTCVIS